FAAVMPELKRLGLNFVVLRSAGGTAAYYASKVQPDIQDPLAPDGDSLAEAVKHAHANGLELHAYVNNCIVQGRSSPETLARLRAAGRLQESPQGQPIDWFCPSHPENLEAIERPMLEIATRYGVDGVQYDFIRYPNSQGCFCKRCRALFEKETGKPVADWPAEVMEGARHGDWVEFRCRRISAIVQRVSSAIRQAAPRVKISAAVFSNWPDNRDAVGQDWVRWCKEGWLDFVCPMNYTRSPAIFVERARVHREALPPGFPMVQGIGINAGTGRMEQASELAVQIALARQQGAAGFIGFAYQEQHTAALFAPLTDWLK
ncbi:MAG: family 10 glycosylhydrolase, partial [Armatimonadota bacterium]|nr:family 10 glycosylhydrolase [Armatimonadota bacterium]